MKNNVVQYLMVTALIVGAYFVGVYKTRTEFLEKGQTAKVAEVAGEKADVPAKEKTELSNAEWEKAKGEGAAYVFGEEGAPVTIVEFTDYQCPFCARYIGDTYPQLSKNYIETGKARYVIRDLPLPFHAQAEKAAVAARCAGKQDRYLAMHDQLFANQKDWEESQDSKSLFVSYAKKIGLAADSFESCLADQATLDAVQADAALAAELGASGTPTFAINGKLLVGAQPYAAFSSLIDAQL